MTFKIQANISNSTRRLETGQNRSSGGVSSFSIPTTNYIQHNVDEVNLSKFHKTPVNVNFGGLLSNFNTPIKNYKTLEKTFRDLVGVDISRELSKIKEQFPDAIKIVDGNLEFKEKGTFNSLAESLLFPFIKMPFMLADFGLETLMKLPSMRENKTLNKLYNSTILTDKRNAERLSEQYNSIKGLYQTLSEKDKTNLSKDQLDKLFLQTLKRFDANIGNYNTVHERSLNRIVAGIIPALIFLGNDAHNVYIDTKNDIKGAKKEAQIRRNQELMRVAVTAYLQLITLGAVSKYANKSAFVTIACILAPVMVSESLSRYLQNKPLTFMSKEETKAFNKKVDTKQTTKPDKLKNAKQTKQTFDNLSAKPDSKVFEDFTSNSQKVNQNTEKEQKKGIKDTIQHIAILLSGMATVGFGLKFAKGKNDGLNNTLNFIGEFDKSMIKLYGQTPYEISKSGFETVMKAMRRAGYENLSEKYEEKFLQIAKTNVSGNYELGMVDKHRTPWLRAAVTPVQFLVNLACIPYKIVNDSIKLFKKPMKLTDAEIKKNALEEMQKILTTSLATMNKDIKELASKHSKTPFNTEELQRYFEGKILSAFNSETLSQQSNNILAKTVSFWSRVLTSYFLIVDDHGVVMRATDGENEDEAWIKAKSRVVQRGSNIFMSQMLIDLFNKTFAKTYLNSLAGMSAVTMGGSYVIEHLARWSIGMPTQPCTKDEIDNYRRSHENAQGLNGSYFRFWTKLSGRKLMKEQDVEKA